MEEELLEEMIRDRESQITVIKKKLDDQKKKMERLKKHLGNVKEKLKTDTMEQQLEMLHDILTTAWYMFVRAWATCHL